MLARAPKTVWAYRRERRCLLGWECPAVPMSTWTLTANPVPVMTQMHRGLPLSPGPREFRRSNSDAMRGARVHFWWALKR